MLSPEQFHKRIPRDLKKNLRWRQHVLKATDHNPRMRLAVELACKRDILFFINTFVWQYDPTDGGGLRVGPFISWQFQDRLLLDRPEVSGYMGLLWCIENKKPMVWEKSRELGATWLLLISQAWICIFFNHFQALDISKSAAAVDDQTRNSLFAKIRFINENLPVWLRGDLSARKEMYIGYKKTNSEIAGEASSKRSGVGGRGGLVGIDEAAEIEELHQLIGKLASTAPCRVFISTHLGPNNAFNEVANNPAYVTRRLHWTQHPRKNHGLYSYDMQQKKLRWWKYFPETDRIVESPGATIDYPDGFEFIMNGSPAGGACPGIRSPWYDAKAKEIGDPRLVAVQLDIDVGGSVQQFFDPLVIRELQATLCRPPLWEGDVVYDSDGRSARIIPKVGGALRLWFDPGLSNIIRSGFYAIGADCSGGTGTTPSCLGIIDCVTGIKVGSYVNANIDPKEFGTLIYATGHLFSTSGGTPAMVSWEHRGPGTTTGVRLIDLRYPSLLRSRRTDQIGKPISDKYGWSPEGHSKELLIYEYMVAMKKREYGTRDEQELEECLDFKYDKSGKVVHSAESSPDNPAGAKSNHGDRVIAAAQAWMLAKQSGKLIAGAPEVTAAEETPSFWHQSMQGRREVAERRERQVGRWA